MPRTICIVACLLLPAGCIAGPLGVPNGGFEDPGDGDIPHWSWARRGGRGSAVVTTDDSHSGSASALVHHDAPRPWSFRNSARIPVEPGKTYRTVAWVRVQKGWVRLRLIALAKGTETRLRAGSKDKAEAGDQWQRIYTTVEIPAGCEQVYVELLCASEATALIDDVALAPWRRPKGTKVKGYAAKRVTERMGRGLLAMPTRDGKIYVGWRLLATDPKGAAFDVYRLSGEGAPEKLNPQPIRKTTDFLDETASNGVEYSYFVQPAGADAPVRAPSEAAVATAGDGKNCLSFPLKGNHDFQKVGIADLDGDGRYDFVIKQPKSNVDPYSAPGYWRKSPGTYKVEAYRHDGQFLWRLDLGWSIEQGVWYSPYVVCDLDGNGRAEVALKTGIGDGRDADGRVRTGPEYLTILDGMTGKKLAQIDWPSREKFFGPSAYNYQSRNQLAVAYLDGKTPCLIVERGTYNIITVIAYQFCGGKLTELWRWCNDQWPDNYWGQGAHSIRVADVDADGRDEVVIGSAVIDDDGTGLWSTGLGHPDHVYVGDLDPQRKGLEIYYGMETRQRRNGMCMVDARTGKFLWGYDRPTKHIHGRGMASDVDPRHPGAECYSKEKDSDDCWLRDAKGNVLSTGNMGGTSPWAVHWDANPQRELIRRRAVRDYEGKAVGPRVAGHIAAIADILGDWREEIIVSLPGQLRIYTTTIQASDRRVCLMQDPIYRADVVSASMGYPQLPTLSYDMATRKK